MERGQQWPLQGRTARLPPRMLTLSQDDANSRSLVVLNRSRVMPSWGGPAMGVPSTSAMLRTLGW